jgi:3-hydroxyacyl-CoA dehydrogenase
MKRTIKKVAVIGSIMGSGIACHFANMVSKFYFSFLENLLRQKQKGLTLESTVVRNRLVNEHLNTALKSKPLLFTLNSLLTASQLETRRYGKIADVDWIIEVVVERLDIKN